MGQGGTQGSKPINPVSRTIKIGRVCDAYPEEENDQSIELIHAESNFKFIKMHLISHYRHHIYQFGNLPMYSTEYGERAHKEQMKDS